MQLLLRFLLVDVSIRTSTIEVGVQCHIMLLPLLTSTPSFFADCQNTNFSFKMEHQLGWKEFKAERQIQKQRVESHIQYKQTAVLHSIII